MKKEDRYGSHSHSHPISGERPTLWAGGSAGDHSAELVAGAGLGGGTPAQGRFSAPQGSLTLPELAQRASDPIEVELHHAADESSVSFAVAGVELAVDMETGQIELLIA